MHRWSFDNFAPDDCADIEIDAAVVDDMVVVRFVVLRRVGVVVDRRRAAFLDMRREQVAEGLVGCERLVGVVDKRTEIGWIAASQSRNRGSTRWTPTGWFTWFPRARGPLRWRRAPN